LEELSRQAQHAAERAAREAERQTLAECLADLAARRDRTLDLHIRGHLDAAAMESRLTEVTTQYTKTEARFAALCGNDADVDEPWIAPDLLAELRARLDEGFDAQTRRPIARLLVKLIRGAHGVDEWGKKTASLTVTYRFPSEPTDGVEVDRCADRVHGAYGMLPPRAVSLARYSIRPNIRPGSGASSVSGRTDQRGMVTEIQQWFG
jgi:hypothetical protein